MLFVGKAPYGFEIENGENPWTLSQMLSQAKRCFAEKEDTAFWRFLYCCMKRVLSLPDERVSRRYGAWTNLMKIGRWVPPAGTTATQPRSGNPGGPLAALQRSECKALLELEIRKLAPTGIVFLTRYYQWNLMEEGDTRNKRLFGSDKPPSVNLDEASFRLVRIGRTVRPSLRRPRSRASAWPGIPPGGGGK
jgi:hypothetical protein